MNRRNKLLVLCSRRFALFAALLAWGLLFTATSAKAGCAIPYKPAAATPSSVVFLNPHGDEGSKEPATIVGLWHVIYTATYSTSGPLPVPVIPPGPPSSFQFTESFKTWHADGTEFENAFLPPTGGNICFGVWKDLGDGSVKLRHLGLMFDSMGNVSAIFTVDEIDTVAPNGKSYKGSFTFKIWPPAYDQIGVGTPLQEIKGTIAGTRVTVE